MKIYERDYDNPKSEDGTDKPNKLLGEFEIVEGKMDDYSYVVFGKDDKGELYKITGTEVSGYYCPGKGGTKNTIKALSECKEVKIYLKYNT